MPGAVAFTVAALAAMAMGMAIQRGATCVVAAVDEVVNHRKAKRFLALGEAALWVTAGIVLARMLGLTRSLAAVEPAVATSIAGGTLLGIGAVINRACVFGAIARLGSGEWAYLATPPGFLFGCWITGELLTSGSIMPVAPAQDHMWGVAAILLVGSLIIWRVSALAVPSRRAGIRERLTSPHAATAAIGIAFVLLLVTVGPWTYTEALADVAAGHYAVNATKILLFLALLAGAIAGGVATGQLRSSRPTPASLLRCFSGGALMAAGTLLVPGGNDGLILVGLPMLQMHAILGLAAMTVTIAGALILKRRT